MALLMARCYFVLPQHTTAGIPRLASFGTPALFFFLFFLLHLTRQSNCSFCKASSPKTLFALPSATMKASIASLVFTAALAAAQDLSGLPSCATACVTKFTTGTQIGGCKQLDIGCICGNADFLNGIACCLASACSKSDQNTAISFAQQICSSSGVTVPDQVVCKDSSSTQAGSGTATGQSGSSKTTGSSDSSSTGSSDSSSTGSSGSSTTGSSDSSTTAADTTSAPASTGTGSTTAAPTGSSAKTTSGSATKSAASTTSSNVAAPLASAGSLVGAAIAMLAAAL
ncbi:hypothetical protein GGI43DRAFT_317657 [Trichoderma evansii]